MSARFLVLASNSFTGSHFVNYALQKGHEVLGISRSPEYNPVLLPYKYPKATDASRFKFVQLDLNTSLNRVVELADDFQPDYVLNYSAQGEVRNSWKWPDQWFQTNTMSVVNLSTALLGKKYLRKYVAASTPEVYGATGENVVENHTYHPSTPYAVSKLAGDLHLMSFVKRYDFPACFTRAANLYGIHQQLYRIIPRTVIYARLGKKIELHGGGRAVRSFIHARDVADATYKVCLSGVPGEVYHLSPQNESFTIAQVVRMICEMMGKRFEDCVTMIDENFGQDAIFSMDSAKIRRELDWSPQVHFEDGVREVIQWIDREWETIGNLPHDYVHQK